MLKTKASHDPRKNIRANRIRIELAAAKPHGSQFSSEQAIRLLLEIGLNKPAIACLLEIAEFNIQHVRYFA